MSENTIQPNQNNKDFIKTPKGNRFAPGNQVAKGNKHIKIDKDTLIEAMQIVEKDKKKAFFVRAFEMAYSNPAVMNKMLDKFVADISISESKDIKANQFNIIIQTYSDRKKEEKDITNK